MSSYDYYESGHSSLHECLVLRDRITEKYAPKVAREIDSPKHANEDNFKAIAAQAIADGRLVPPSAHESVHHRLINKSVWTDEARKRHGDRIRGNRAQARRTAGNTL